MSTRKGTARQDGRFWLVEVDDVGVTQARHLREVDDMAADLVATMLDVPVEDVQVDVTVELPEDVAADLAKVEHLHQVEADARSQAADLRRSVVQKLAARGLPMRDVGKALGISYQRAHQLASGEDRLTR